MIRVHAAHDDHVRHAMRNLALRWRDRANAAQCIAEDESVDEYSRKVNRTIAAQHDRCADELWMLSEADFTLLELVVRTPEPRDG